MSLKKTVGNVQFMQKMNRLKVLNYIRQKQTVSRPEIAQITGLSPSSITNITAHLFRKKFIKEMGKIDSKEVGRKAGLIRFNPSAYHIVSVDIEISRIYLALTNLDDEVVKLKDVEIESSKDDRQILDVVKKEIKKMIRYQKQQGSSRIAGIGIAVSGSIQNEEKLMLSSSLGWKDLVLKKYFEDSFHLPVYVQNNSKTKALAVLKTEVRQPEVNIIFLDLTMGVRIINFYHGKINESVIGEFNHTTVKKDGPLCFCGNRGCLEVMCTVDSIVHRCNELLEEGRCRGLSKIAGEKRGKITYDTVLQAFEAGDKDVSAVLKECGEYLGLGIANLINIFGPQRIIINGDILLECDFIYQVALKEIDKRAFEHFRKDVVYQRGSISKEEAIKGISFYVVDRLFDLDGPEV